MGHQFQIYVLDDDIQDIEEAVRRHFDVAIVPCYSKVAIPRPVPTMKSTRGAPPGQFNLAQAHRVGEIVVDHISEQQEWATDTLRSPVIKLNLSCCDGVIVGRGRAYYADRYVEHGKFVEKDDEFKTWARAVYKIVKRTLVMVDACYLGRHVIDALSDGTISLHDGQTAFSPRLPSSAARKAGVSRRSRGQ